MLQLFSWPDIFQFYESLPFVYQPESGVLEIRKANNRKVINFMQFRSNGKVRVRGSGREIVHRVRGGFGENVKGFGYKKFGQDSNQSDSQKQKFLILVKIVK